jgi:hypothetical protein
MCARGAGNLQPGRIPCGESPNNRNLGTALRQSVPSVLRQQRVVLASERPLRVCCLIRYRPSPAAQRSPTMLLRKPRITVLALAASDPERAIAFHGDRRSLLTAGVVGAPNVRYLAENVWTSGHKRLTPRPGRNQPCLKGELFASRE